ncbi:MAG: HupE/UreJ family protein [Luteibaculum sp.]
MDFNFYLKQGINHILDLAGYDHMLFVIALCALYELRQWKKVLILLTAFTLGHSVTLLLSGLNMLRLPQDLIETLIPITIFLTALNNILFYNKMRSSKTNYNYFVALVFGFIHGAGFSNFYRSMLADIEESVVLPLLAFNIGIELGQIVIVAVFFAMYYLIQLFASFPHQRWNVAVSIFAATISGLMIIGAI